MLTFNNIGSQKEGVPAMHQQSAGTPSNLLSGYYSASGSSISTVSS